MDAKRWSKKAGDLPTIIWIDDYDDDTADPQDGDEPLRFWWEDMRPREVRDLVKESYERGFNRGVLEAKNLHRQS